jgi:hypothetical protein
MSWTAASLRSDSTSAERHLRKALQEGRTLDLMGEASEDVTQGATLDSKRTIRGELIVRLLTGRSGAHSTNPRDFKLRGARITGHLDATGLTLPGALCMKDCYFDQPIVLRETTARTIRLPGCCVPALDAEQLKTEGNLDLNHGFICLGSVCLAGAKVGGQFDLSDSLLGNDHGIALNADRITISQSMVCKGRLQARGQIRLVGAHIVGQLAFNGAMLNSNSGPALIADGAAVDQGLYFRDGFGANGQIRLVGAQIGGQVDFADARLRSAGINETALLADRLNVDGNVFCGLSADGGLRLVGAEIRGTLDLSQTVLSGSGCPALDLRSSNISELLLPSQRPEGIVDVTDAKTRVLTDEPSGWPYKIRLSGFTYKVLEKKVRWSQGPPASAHVERVWLCAPDI